MLFFNGTLMELRTLVRVVADDFAAQCRVPYLRVRRRELAIHTGVARRRSRGKMDEICERVIFDRDSCMAGRAALSG